MHKQEHSEEEHEDIVEAVWGAYDDEDGRETETSSPQAREKSTTSPAMKPGHNVRGIVGIMLRRGIALTHVGGDEWGGTCPLHNLPMKVNAAKNTWWCPTCRHATPLGFGTAIDAVERLDGVSAQVAIMRVVDEDAAAERAATRPASEPGTVRGVRYGNAYGAGAQPFNSTVRAFFDAAKKQAAGALQSIEVKDPRDPKNREHNDKMKKNGPAIALARFRDGQTRKNENVVAMSGLVMDLDDIDENARGEVFERLGGVAFCAWTTFGSRWAKPGECWRVVVPFSHEVPAADWPGVWQALCLRFAPDATRKAGHLVDVTTKNLERLAFLPRAPRKVWCDRELVSNHPVGFHEGSGMLFDPRPVVSNVRRSPPASAPTMGRSTTVAGGTGDVLERARAYMQKADVAVQGQHGSDTAISRIGTMVRGFDLTTEQALAVLAEWNARCVPPWNENELRHKVQDAQKPDGRGRGWLLREDRRNGPSPILRAHAVPVGVAATPDDEKPEPELPDPMPLSRIPPATPLPLELLPDVVRGFVEVEAELKAVEPEMVAIPALVALAASIGKDARLTVSAGWVERACLWGVVIAPPGSTKTAAQEAAIKPLRAAEKARADRLRCRHDAWNEASKRASAVERGWERAVENAAKDGKPPPDRPTAAEQPPDRPPTHRLIVSNATGAKLADLMAQGSRGLTLVLDELSDFLENFSRGNQQGTDRPFFLSAHAGTPIPIDRVGRGEVPVDDPYLSIIGGIQPSKAKELFQVGDDGLFERFGLMAFPTETPPWRARQSGTTPAHAAYARTIEELAAAEWDPDKPLQLSPGAAEAFAAFEEKWGKARCRGDWPEDQAGFYGKSTGLVSRLVLVFQLAEWGAAGGGPLPLVEHGTMARVIAFVETYLMPTWNRVVGLLQSSPRQVGTQRVARWLLEKRPETVRPADISKLQWRGMTTADEVRPILADLEAAGWLLPVSRKVDANGRPSAARMVNPRIFERAWK